jgi:cytochrome c biogenesis protein CcmG, thiol:disulfide interchange protein DsbE
MNWKRSLVAAVCVIPLILLFGWGLTRDPKEIPSPLPGHDAPPFALAVFAPGQPPLNRAPGDTVRFADLKNQVLVLNFWASWCLSCRDEHAILSEVARSYAGKPVHFLGVLYNDEAENGTKWIADMGGQSYPSVMDPGARTAINYGLYGVPETYFIANGRIAYKATGPVNERIVRHLVDSLMTVASNPAPASFAP